MFAETAAIHPGISNKGNWNASTNTPSLSDGSGVIGDYYLVIVAGTQDLGSGVKTYRVGDEVKYNGTIWNRIGSDQNASEVLYDNSSSGLSATDLQGAVDEVEGRVDTLESSSHTQNSDLFLDFGNANQISAAETRSHLNDTSIHFVINDITPSTSSAYSSQFIQTNLDNLAADLGGRLKTAVQDITALKSIDTTSAVDFPDKTLINVEDNGLYRLDRQAVDAEDIDRVIQPTVGVGRWFKMSSSINDHNLLSNIQGGVTGERNHLSNADVADLGFNTTHRTNSGVDHTFIDQDMKVTAFPQHIGLLLDATKPYISFTQNGSGEFSYIGLTPTEDEDPAGNVMIGDVTANDLIIHNNHADGIQFGVNGRVWASVKPGYLDIRGDAAFDAKGEIRFAGDSATSISEDVSDSLAFFVAFGRIAFDTPNVRITDFGDRDTTNAQLDVEFDIWAGTTVTAIGKMFSEGRDVSTDADGVTSIFTMANFPAAISGTRTLTANNEDRIKGLSLTSSDDFAVPDAGTNNIKSDGFNIHTLTYMGVSTYFTGGGVGFLQFFDLTIFGNSSATLFDIIGGNLPATQVAMVQSRADNFLSLGTLNSIFFLSNKAAYINNINGITLFNPTGFIFDAGPMFNITPLGSTHITIDGDTIISGTIKGLDITASSGETAVNIRPTIHEDSSITIEDTRFIDSEFTQFLGDVFFVGVTGSITVIADASTGAISITSVTDSSGVARFNFTGPTVYAFQKVTISLYVTNTAYNGTFIITDTDGTTYFEISKIAFGTNEAGGSFLSDSITVTSTAHGRTNGEGLSIKDSINHNVGSYVYNSLANTFQVNKGFTATETATWDTSSLDQTDPRVFSASNNIGLNPSFAIGSFTVSENTTETDFTGVTIGDYIDMKFDSVGAIIGSNAELFEMINSNNAEMRYIGQKQLKGSQNAAFSLIKTGSSAIYRIRVIVDGVDGAPIEVEVKSTVVTCPFEKDVVISNSQNIKYQMANMTNQQNATVKFLNSGLK